MNNIHNLTIVIVTYRTDIKILLQCLDSIDPSTNILIVENSKNNPYLGKLENKYPNVNIVMSGKNLGYGAGNNFGLKIVKTKYALILNPDVILEKSFFKEIDKYLDQRINFHIIGINYKDETKWKASGTFDEFDTKLQTAKEGNPNNDSLKEVDWVVGCGMLINLEKFSDRKLFDENFFLYFEEFDLCRRIRKKQGKVYSSKNLFLEHLGNKGSLDPDNLEFISLRNWHWMWSSFYYHKKHYGYFYAVYKTYGKLIRSIFRIILYLILFDKKKFLIYFSRASGIINAMLGSKSKYRVK